MGKCQIRDSLSIDIEDILGGALISDATKQWSGKGVTGDKEDGR